MESLNLQTFLFLSLLRVSQKFSPTTPQQQQQLIQQQQQQQQQQQLLTLEEAQAIRAELLNIQRSLSSGEQEKQELMRSLACLKDDLTRCGVIPQTNSKDVYKLFL